MKKLSVFFLMALVFFACSSIEGEQEAWAKQVKKVKELSLTYPAFAQYLQFDLKKAEKVKAEADAISDENAKLEKLSEANEVLNSQLIRDLAAIQFKIDRVNKLIKQVSNKKFSSTEIQSVERAIEKGRNEVNKAERLLANGSTTTKDAETALRETTGNLISAAGAIQRYTKTKKKKKKKSA